MALAADGGFSSSWTKTLVFFPGGSDIQTSSQSQSCSCLCWLSLAVQHQQFFTPVYIVFSNLTNVFFALLNNVFLTSIFLLFLKSFWFFCWLIHAVFPFCLNFTPHYICIFMLSLSMTSYYLSLFSCHLHCDLS